jgi:hypothetical protein
MRSRLDTAASSRLATESRRVKEGGVGRRGEVCRVCAPCVWPRVEGGRGEGRAPRIGRVHPVPACGAVDVFSCVQSKRNILISY